MKKKSVGIMWGVLVFLVLAIFAAVLGLRILAGSVMKTASRPEINGREMAISGSWRQLENISLQGVWSVSVNGLWDIHVEQGSVPELKLEIPEPWGKYTRVFVQDDELVLDCSPGVGFREVKDRKCEAHVVLPSLKSLNLYGTGQVGFSGFHEEKLTVHLDGMGKISGRDSGAASLFVSVDGIGQIDLRNVPAKDVYVALDGMGEMKVNVDGGVLDGALDGIGSITYYGKVSENRIKTDGLGKVIAGK